MLLIDIPFILKYCFNRYKTHDTLTICVKTFDAYPIMSRYVSDWFVTPKILEVLYKNYHYFNDSHELFTWCNKYNQCKTFIKEIEKELMSIRGHLLRWWDWYMSEDEKKVIEKYWNNDDGSN